MADLSITPANVKLITSNDNTVLMDGIAGETITAGMVVYFDSATGLLKKALAAAGSGPAGAAAVGIALNGASLNQPLRVAKSGATVYLGAVGTAGAIYAVSATAGGIAPVADLVSTNYVTFLGIIDGSGNLLVQPSVRGVQKA